LSRTGLDVLLEPGPLPPRPALAIVEALADRLQRSGPVAADALRPMRVRIAKDGAVDFDGAAPGDEPGTVGALGALLHEMLTGTGWSSEAAVRDGQLDGLRRSLGGIPNGKDVASLVGQLTDPAFERRPTLAAVRDRCLVLQGRVGGVPLRPFLAELLGPGDTPAPPPAVERPDDLTASYPAGAVAAMIAHEHAGAGTRAGHQDSIPHFVPPPAAGEPNDDIHNILKELAEVPPEELGLADPAPAAPRPKRPPPKTTGPMFGFVVGVLIALVVVLVWILMM
jgi:hypothetical protein